LLRFENYFYWPIGSLNVFLYTILIVIIMYFDLNFYEGYSVLTVELADADENATHLYYIIGKS